MKDNNALNQFRVRLLQEIEKFEKLAKNQDNTPLEAHQKVLDGIKLEIDKNLEAFHALEKAEMQKTAFGLASGTPSEAEVHHENKIPVKSVFEILKSDELEKGMGTFHAMRVQTKGDNSGQMARDAARNKATAIQSPAPRTKSIPSKLKMSHGDYGITKNVDGSLSLIYNKKYKSPVLHFLFGNKPKELGRFGHRAEAYQALLGHHDQVNAGLIKGEKFETDTTQSDLQPKIPHAVIPSDKKSVRQDDKDTGSGGQVKSSKSLMKEDGTGVVPAPKPAANTSVGLAPTKISSPRAMNAMNAGPKLPMASLPKITPQPAKPVSAGLMNPKTLLTSVAGDANTARPRNAMEDRANIAHGISMFSKDEEKGEMCKNCGKSHGLEKCMTKGSFGPIDGGGAVSGDNPMDKAEESSENSKESPEKELEDLNKSKNDPNIHYYMSEGCPHFAIYLHRTRGWPIRMLTDKADGTIAHVYNVHPDTGMVHDAKGVRTEKQLKDEFWDLQKPSIEYVAGEKGLKRHMGDNRPLHQHSETEIAEAGALADSLHPTGLQKMALTNGGKDPMSRMMTAHAMGDAAKKALVQPQSAAATFNAKLPSLPSPAQHAQRAETFSDFMPKGKFSKNELIKEMESMDKWTPKA